jgi:hypothetical protein
MEHLGVDPWKKQTAEWIKPDTEVYYARLYNDNYTDGLLHQYAYLSKEALKEYCFWFKESYVDGTPKWGKTTFSEYLKMHLKECSPMNPFWAIGRMEFLNEYYNQNYNESQIQENS